MPAAQRLSYHYHFSQLSASFLTASYISCAETTLKTGHTPPRFIAAARNNGHYRLSTADIASGEVRQLFNDCSQLSYFIASHAPDSESVSRFLGIIGFFFDDFSIIAARFLHFG